MRQRPASTLQRDAGMGIGARVRAWRLHGARSQAELERLAGLSHNALSRIENGEVQPRLETLERLADALGIGVEMLQFKLPPTASVHEDGTLPNDLRELVAAVQALPAARRASVVDLLLRVVREVQL